jgi:hypothetical protein
MTLGRARANLLAVFLIGFIAQAAMTVVVYLNRAITSADVTNLLVTLLSVYSVPMAVMLGGLFASKISGKASAKNQPAFLAALVLATIWNILLLSRFALFVYAGFNTAVDDSAEKVSAYVDQIAKASSFLVAGSLAYFFSGAR